VVFDKSKWISQHENTTAILRSLKMGIERYRIWRVTYLFIWKYSFSLTLHLQIHMKNSSSGQPQIWEAALCALCTYGDIFHIIFHGLHQS